MKTFIISTAIFLALIAIIIINYIYINDSADKLDDMAKAIIPGSENIDESITKLEKLWDKIRFKLELSTNHSLINEIGIKISNIRLLANDSANLQLTKELMLLREKIKELRRLERLSLENIF